MLYAYVKGTKMEAIPKIEGICPVCESPVISKCGSIYIWHWAHKPGIYSCTGGEETEWHRAWKSIFPKDIVEVVKQRNAEKYRADVLLPNGWVLEFQNSPIKEEVVLSRNHFWKKVFWIYNLEECRERIRFWDKGSYYTFCWRRPRRYPTFGNIRRIAWDIGNYVFVPKRIYDKSFLSGWGNLYSELEFEQKLFDWGCVDNNKV
jgi:hypothetical protein